MPHPETPRSPSAGPVRAAALAALGAVALWITSCSSGLGNNLPTQPNSNTASAEANLPTGLDLGVVPTDPVREPAIAGLVVPTIAGAAPTEVVLVAFTTESSSADADGQGTALARDATVDGNGARDVFVAALCAADIDRSAFSQSLAGKFRHPRCATCHSMAAPTTTAFATSSQPHAGPPPGTGFPNNDAGSCAPCHVNSTNFPVVGWQAPAASFDFRTKTVAELATAAQGVPIDESEHFFTDKRVLWALDSGILPQVGGRNGIADDDHDGIAEPEDEDGVIRTVPGGSASFFADIEAWNNGGRVTSTASAVHDVTLVSRSNDGVTAGNGPSSRPRLLWVENSSFNGTSQATALATNPIGWLYVAFESDASNLVAGDTNGATDVFRARIALNAEQDATGATVAGSLNLVFETATVLASAVHTASNPGNGASTRAVLGGTRAATPAQVAAGNAAQFVAFVSEATDLVPGFADNNGAGTDVFVRDLFTDQTVLLSHTPGASTSGGDGTSVSPAISAAGDVVAFASDATDLVASDTNEDRDIFYTDRTTGAPFALVRASVQTGGGEADGGDCDAPSVSSDGAGTVRVAFESQKTNLVSSIGAARNVYLHDSRSGGSTSLLNQQLLTAAATVVGAAGVGTPGDGDAQDPVIASDGSLVVFASRAENLDVLRDDTNGFRDIFAVEVAQVEAGKVVPYRLNITGNDGGEANGDSEAPAFGSFAGASTSFPVGFAVYRTEATNLGTSDSTPLIVSFVDETSGVQAAFTATPTSGAAPLTVQFTDESSGNPTSWSWDLDGDGNADSTERNPSFTYTTPGAYSVTLNATNANTTGTVTRTDLIRAYGPPASNFTIAPSSGVAPLTVTFTDTSTEDPTSWSWDLDGDGNEDSTQQNPTFVYATPGVYSPSLTATGPGGTGTTLVQTDAIVVAAPVVADFTPSTTSGLAPLSVTFTDTTSGAPTAWSWDFDNDGNPDSTAQNPTFVYTNPGSYTVSLTATGPGGTDTETKTDLVAVAGPVVANFTSNVTSGYAPANVTFTDTSTGTISNWAWDFDNDGNTDSTAQNPSHTYTTPGVYTVRLAVSGAGGSDDELKTNYFTAVVSSVAVSFGAAKDNTIYEESTNNSHGLGADMVAGNAATTGGVDVGTRRAMVQFDVSSIPAGSTILSAALTLTNTLVPPVQGVGTQSVSLYRLTQDWTEGTSNAGVAAGMGTAAASGGATWNEATSGSTAWGTVGGSFLPGVRASRSIGEVANTPYTWASNASLVADVQLWLDTPAQNFGWMLRGGETATTRTVKWFATRDNATPSFRPSLAITYQPPLP